MTTLKLQTKLTKQTVYAGDVLSTRQGVLYRVVKWDAAQPGQYGTIWVKKNGKGETETHSIELFGLEVIGGKA